MEEEVEGEGEKKKRKSVSGIDFIHRDQLYTRGVISAFKDKNVVMFSLQSLKSGKGEVN